MLDSTNITFHLLVSTNTIFSIHAGLISVIRLMDTNSNCLNVLNVGIINITIWSIFSAANPTTYRFEQIALVNSATNAI